MDDRQHINSAPEGSNGPEDRVIAEGETYQIPEVALYAFGLNLFLAALQGVLAISSGSLAVTTGAIDSPMECSCPVNCAW